MPPYNGVNEYFRRRFGCKVYKLALDGGFTCPNRDGTVGTKGCIFCLEGSGGFAQRCIDAKSLRSNVELAKKRVNKKVADGKYIAYFQAYTGTYGDIEYMKELYGAVSEIEDIVAISIGTRPDCLPEDVLEMLASLNNVKPVIVELGLQTIHEKTAEYIRRGYSLQCFVDAANRLRQMGIEVVTHVILGLPGETEEMMLETVKLACKYSNGIKLQLLHVLQGTDLANDYENGLFSVLSMEQYVDLVKKCVDIIPENVIIHRITGDGDKRHLIAPRWSADKKRVLNALNKVLQK